MKIFNFLYTILNGCTGQLKLKYPTGQNAISRQLCEIFIPKFLGLHERDPAAILKFLKNYFSFLQSHGCIIFYAIFSILHQIINSNLYFHCKETLTVITNTRISQVVHFSICSKCPPPAFTQAQSLREAQYGFVDRVLWQLVPYQWQNFLELIDVLLGSNDL